MSGTAAGSISAVAVWLGLLPETTASHQSMLCRPALEAALANVKVEEAPADLMAELDSPSDGALTAGAKDALDGITQVRPITRAPLCMHEVLNVHICLLSRRAGMKQQIGCRDWEALLHTERWQYRMRFEDCKSDCSCPVAGAGASRSHD